MRFTTDAWQRLREWVESAQRAPTGQGLVVAGAVLRIDDPDRSIHSHPIHTDRVISDRVGSPSVSLANPRGLPGRSAPERHPANVSNSEPASREGGLRVRIASPPGGCAQPIDELPNHALGRLRQGIEGDARDAGLRGGGASARLPDRADDATGLEERAPQRKIAR